MNTRKQKNILIGGLLAIVLVMAIAYAAFASQLNITGTSNISSNWNIKITGIRGVNLGLCNDILPSESSATPSIENKVEFLPSTTDEVQATQMLTKVCYNDNNNAYDVTAPTYDNTNGLTASFQTGLKLPGDTRIYEIEVTNQGDLNANITKTLTDNTNNPAIEITYDGVSRTSILAEDGTYKKSSLSTGEPFTLNKNNKKYVYITVKYSDSVTSQPSNLNASVTLSLNATQKTSASSGSGIDTSGNVIYAYNTNGVDVNSPITDINNQFTPSLTTSQKYCVVEIADSSNSCLQAFDTEQLCQAEIDLGVQNGWFNEGEYTCNQQTVIEEESGYNYFLKHNIENNVITSSEVCFVHNGSVHCIKPNEYDTSVSYLQSIFGENACYVGDDYFDCSAIIGFNVSADSDGYVFAADGSDSCRVASDGSSSCKFLSVK